MFPIVSDLEVDGQSEDVVAYLVQPYSINVCDTARLKDVVFSKAKGYLLVDGEIFLKFSLLLAIFLAFSNYHVI